jgi:integrase
MAATNIGGKRFWQVTSPKVGGGRARRTFKNRNEASAYLDLVTAQVGTYGPAAMSITDSLRTEAVRCAEELKAFGKTLTDATRFYIEHLTEINRSQTVAHAVKALQDARKADGSSVRYLRDLKYRLGQFEESFGARHIATITTAEIDDWLRNLGLGTVSRNTFRRRLVTLFKFAKTHGWCRTIPPAESARVTEVSDEVGILTPDELAGLLNVASEDMVPYWTIGAFAGLRAAEIERLEWTDVNLERRWIKVQARNSKTAARRIVMIQPNLLTWLNPYADRTGRVVPDNLRFHVLEDRKRAAKAGVLKKWPNNALRHSFASYHLAKFNDAARLALELGHVGQDIIFRHYREVVTPDDAERYWTIEPVTAASAAKIVKAV